MSYIVIHTDSSGNPTFKEFEDVATAVKHLEETCNGVGSAGTRLCRLDPVEFEVKQCVKVEISTTPVRPSAATPIPDPDDEAESSVPDRPAITDVGDVEGDPVRGESQFLGESRRGLFGR